MARLLLSAAAAAAKESHFACFPNCTGSPVCSYDRCILSPTTLPDFPLDPPPADDGSVSVGISHKHRLIQSFLIAAAALLAFAFFMLLVFYFLLRLRRRRRRQLAALHQQHPPPPLDPNADDDLLDDDGGLHHVWYIRTVGLDDSVIKSIAATIYKAGDGLIDGGDCSVCLGEFREGETIKLLPKCTHAFHLSCIDTWLRSHVNCPLCRAPVVAPPPPPAASPAEAGGSVPSPENAQIEISQRESQEECVIAIDSAAAASSSSGQLDGDGDGEVQPIRRSVSMDSLALGMLLLRAESESDAEEKLGEEKREIEVEGAAGAHKNKGKGVAVVEYLGKQPQGAEMKRSLSARSGRLFLSRYGRGRGRSASVLPL